jgi:hypothetical protein
MRVLVLDGASIVRTQITLSQYPATTTTPSATVAMHAGTIVVRVVALVFVVPSPSLSWLLRVELHIA